MRSLLRPLIFLATRLLPRSPLLRHQLFLLLQLPLLLLPLVSSRQTVSPVQPLWNRHLRRPVNKLLQLRH